VLVVEDDPDIAAAVSLILTSAGVSALEVAGSAEQADARIRRSAPDLLLLDLGLPDRDGVELIRLLRSRAFRAPILVLTSATAPDRILAALRGGADGYLFKEDLDRKLASSLEDLAAGGAPLSHGAAKVVLDDVRRASPRAGEAMVRPSLTPRESAVLELISTGASYPEIGRDLGIEINTVRTHVRSLYDKMGVENRAEAVNLGWTLGFLRTGP
jgi:DNA-binding NarL/FixJ family response regulator